MLFDEKNEWMYEQFKQIMIQFEEFCPAFWISISFKNILDIPFFISNS